MTIASIRTKPFVATFIDAGPKLCLELRNTTDQQLRSVEILTIFLKDDETPGGPSRVHIRFDSVKFVQPEEKVVFAHKTLIDGKPAEPHHDQLDKLTSIAGETKPYVLDISWEDADGKSQYQRIPVGH